MLLKIMGAIDTLGGLILLFGTGIAIPHLILIIFGGLLLIKALFGMLKGFASWIDLVSGVIFILMIFFNIHWIICLIAGILLIQKGIFSFL